MGFKTPDGLEFETKKEWRNYMMTQFYSFKNKKDEPEPLIKKPGDIDGQAFSIEDCENSTLVIMDMTEQIQIDECKNCRIFVGACISSIFIRNCTGCTFYTCCRQLRLREVTDSTFYIYSQAEVHIEYSNTLRFAPFNGGYKEHATHIKNARLDPNHNLWYDIFDHNDAGKTGENWSLVPVSEYEEPWFPQGEPCEPAIKKTKANSVIRTDENAQAGDSFGADQLRADAAAAGNVVTEKANSPPKKVASPPKATPTTSTPVVNTVPPAAMTEEEEEEAEAENIFLTLKTFAKFEKGDSTSWAAEGFNSVLSTNMFCGDLDMFVLAKGTETGPRGDVESVDAIERKGDVAWCTFASSGAGKTCINTAVLVRVYDDLELPWKIATVHSSLAGAGNI